MSSDKELVGLITMYDPQYMHKRIFFHSIQSKEWMIIDILFSIKIIASSKCAINTLAKEGIWIILLGLNNV